MSSLDRDQGRRSRQRIPGFVQSGVNSAPRFEKNDSRANASKLLQPVKNQHTDLFKQEVSANRGFFLRSPFPLLAPAVRCISRIVLTPPVQISVLFRQVIRGGPLAICKRSFSSWSSCAKFRCNCHSGQVLTFNTLRILNGSLPLGPA